MKMRFCFLVGVLGMAATMGYSQQFEWAKHIGNNVQSQGYAIATDNSGNVYSTGFSTDSTFFDLPAALPNLTPSGSQFAYVTKNDSDGNYIWVKQFRGNGANFPLAMDVDNAGNVYTCGFFSDSTDFDPGPGIYKLGTAGSALNSYISKLDAAGNFVWAKKIGNGENYPFGITVDVAGNVFTTGYFQATADFDPGTGVFNLVSAGSDDIFILKLNAGGNFVWAKKMGSTGLDRGLSIAVDEMGSFFLGGRFRGTVDLDPGAGTTSYTAVLTSDDAFIAKFDTSGNFSWAKHITSPGDEYVNGVVADENGNCYLTGMYNDTIYFDAGGANVMKLTKGALDVFLAKFSPSGTLTWVKTFGGTQADNPYSIAYSQSGIYITGSFTDVVDFDPGPGVYSLTTNGALDPFIARFNPFGNLTWAVQLPGGSDGYGMSVAVDTFMNVYATGFFETTIDANPATGDTLNFFSKGGAGDQDIYLLRLSQDLCASLTAVIDSLNHVTCLGSGNAMVHATGGLDPYTYAWNTFPPSADSLATFVSGGIYQLTISDSNTCIKTLSLLINAPDTAAGFNLDASLVAEEFRPAHETGVWIDAFNHNCTATGGALILVLDTSKVTYNYSNPGPDWQTADTLLWNFASLNYDAIHLIPYINLITDTFANFGDTVCLKVLITPQIGDLDTLNNVKDFCFTVINGFDPNDKSVYPVGICGPRYVENDQRLTYTVRFQNTGNGNAINIHVLDSLDPDLDLGSLKVVAQSHPMITKVLPGNALDFRFDNIQLPDTNNNEPGSHGYVIYEIDPLPGAFDGTAVTNKANIYFDYNPAIITNTTLNTLVAALPADCNVTLDVAQHREWLLSIFPNPAKDFFTIENISANSIIKLYDFSGRLILTQKATATKQTISTNNLQNGIFLVEVIDETGERSFQRVIINK
ncbi:MAG: T9SS type A sorting domain-containing protein [Bacteroidia bacterium]|nr:T9SS type A sorting domain-containing protein [Bacteroidia bacterium]